MVPRERNTPALPPRPTEEVWKRLNSAACSFACASDYTSALAVDLCCWSSAQEMKKTSSYSKAKLRGSEENQVLCCAATESLVWIKVKESLILREPAVLMRAEALVHLFWQILSFVVCRRRWCSASEQSWSLLLVIRASLILSGLDFVLFSNIRVKLVLVQYYYIALFKCNQ